MEGAAAAPRAAVTVENFRHYIDFRILDSIGYPGTYKKFMLARKEQGVEWAVEMARHVQAVQNAIHELEQKEQQLRASPLSPLHIVWVHVAESNLPPSDLQLTIANCSISRKMGIPCVVIKGKGRGAQPFTVNSRFCAFLHDIWIVYKIDILIKTFARSCMDEFDPSSQMPMAEVAEAFKVRMYPMRLLYRAEIVDIRGKKPKSSISPPPSTPPTCTCFAPRPARSRRWYNTIAFWGAPYKSIHRVINYNAPPRFF